MLVTYLYDPAGRRRQKTVSGTDFPGTTIYVSDGQEEIEERSGTNLFLRKYAYGSSIDDRIAMIGDASCGARCYFQTNHQGSTVALSRQDTSLAAAYGYDAYGRSSAAPEGNPFRYTGRRLDPETGLYYYRARYYSSNIGRFLQTDPIGTTDDLNLYAYTCNDPLNGIDPLGLDCLTETFTDPGVTSTVTAKRRAPWELLDVPGPLSGRGVRDGPRVGPTAPTPRDSESSKACPGSVNTTTEKVINAVGIGGNFIAAGGALTGLLPVTAIGLGLSSASEVASAATNAYQGDRQGLQADLLGSVAGSISGGRIARRFGGASLDAGRHANGRFKTNWRGKQCAQDELTEGLQSESAKALSMLGGCP